MRVVTLAVFVCLAAFSSPAVAQQEPSVDASEPAAPSKVDDLFKQLDMFGSWAPNCAQPASPANPHVSITEPNEGAVMEEHDIGSEYALNRYSVLAANSLPGDRLAVQVIFQPGTELEERQNLIFVIRGGTRRTLFNQPEGGAVRVKDGVAVGGGFKMPVLKKCG